MRKPSNAAMAAAACVLPDRTGRLHAHLNAPTFRLAALGGSITFGHTPAGAVPPYPLLLSERLTASGIPCPLCNLGISGTDAYMGLYLTDRYLRPFQPDCVIVEYAVNQGASQREASAYESLLWKLLSLPGQPAVIPLMCMMRDGYSSEEYMRELADHYGLPVISVREARKDCPWEAYSADTVHPHANGHQLLADCLWHLLHTESAPSKPHPHSALLDATARTLHTVPLTNGTGGLAISVPFYTFFQDAPAVRLDAAHPVYTCTVLADTFCVIYLQHQTPETSDAMLQIDTEPPVRLPAKSIYGWGNPIIQPITAQNHSGAAHTVSIRLVDAAGIFTIWGIGVQPLPTDSSIIC